VIAQMSLLHGGLASASHTVRPSQGEVGQRPVKQIGQPNTGYWVGGGGVIPLRNTVVGSRITVSRLQQNGQPRQRKQNDLQQRRS